MEERTYTQQEVDELLRMTVEIHHSSLSKVRAEHEEEIKKAEKRPFAAALWGDQYDDWAENGWRENNGYVQTLLREAKAYLQQRLYEFEEEENCAYFRSNGDCYMGDGWYDAQWAVAAALKQVEANEATIENISFNGEGL